MEKLTFLFRHLKRPLLFMNEYFKDIIHTLSKGDTTVVESFLRKPGGRKYLENITLILINALPQHDIDKEEMYFGFVEVLDRMEQRIQRQREGYEILNELFRKN